MSYLHRYARRDAISQSPLCAIKIEKMNVGKNPKEILRIALTEHIGEIRNFNTLGYRVHPDKFCCNCVTLSFEFNSEQKETIDEFLKKNRITEFEFSESENSLKLTKDYYHLRRKFQAMYKSHMPNWKQYAEFESVEIEDLYLILYKTDSLELKHEFIQGKIHDHFVQNKNQMIKSLVVKRKNDYWEIIGSGCSCSTIPTLEPNEIPETMIHDLIKSELRRIKSQ